ncbi:lipopolysaccharide biosynthesis protein [Ornithinimicrobium sp. W1665]|uniref:lipopolysaccharide biosynthesis protein n=1 Tax=Ornithinimicrobium sp. W1665 TaxID=3416666 RepID=UPI003CEC0606
MPEGRARGLATPWTLTLLSYGLSQAVVLAGSLVRIPLITQALGEVGYGRFIVITSVWPAIQILSHGLASTARVVVAEDPARAGPTVRALRSTGTKEAAVVLGAAVVLLPVLGPGVGWGFAWSVLWVAVAAVVVLPISGHHGVLEGVGRTAVSHLALATTTLVGLPVLILALGLRQDLSTIVAASMVGFVAPYLTYRFLTRRLVGLHGPGDAADSGLDGVVLTGLSGAMTGWALSNVLVYLFDPVIIMATTGSAAAGQYGLASRITGLVTAVPVALGGLLTVWFSRARVKEEGVEVIRRLVSSSVVFTLVGVVLAAVTIWVGPWIGQVLGRGAVGTPQDLYTWLGIYGGLTCASSPLVAAWAAPLAAATRARLGVSLGLLNVGLSVVLALSLGAVGPVIATVVCNGMIVLLLALLTWRHPRLVRRTGGVR